MHILILGAGIAGVTTAYFLAERGHQVTVVERQPGSAMETSFANGGQLSYCHAEPWANPATLPKVFKWMFKKDAPLVLTPRLDWHQLTWSLKFLRNCTSERVLQNTATTLRLALYSRDTLNQLERDTSIEFHHWHKGILHVFKTEQALEAAITQSEYQASLGPADFSVFTKQDCLEKEPALKQSPANIVGGMYYPKDESGDIYLFTKTLAKQEQLTGGVEFLYETDIEQILTDEEKITGIATRQRGTLTADAYVLATGSYSHGHLRQIGIRAPIYPMKGYSISIPISNNEALVPNVSLTDQAEKIVYSRLGDIVRVAGTAEFAGYNHSIQPHRIAAIKRAVKNFLPECGDIDRAQEWACLRPSTPDGPPILGTCRYDNLFLNTGHGTLGWTLAPGSGRIIADIIDKKKPEIDLTGMTVARYGG